MKNRKQKMEEGTGTEEEFPAEDWGGSDMTFSPSASITNSEFSPLAMVSFVR